MTRNEQVRLIWRHTHRDYKGTLPDGTRTVMVFRSGSTLVPLADLTPEEIDGMMPVMYAREARRIAKRDAAKAGAR